MYSEEETYGLWAKKLYKLTRKSLFGDAHFIRSIVAEVACIRRTQLETQYTFDSSTCGQNIAYISCIHEKSDCYQDVHQEEWINLVIKTRNINHTASMQMLTLFLIFGTSFEATIEETILFNKSLEQSLKYDALI